ncbi:hypothetical protein ACFPZL_04960 [Leucobacter soli]|uniref:Uncharacterized protein n=1 Tax=Leucobacter soli TaxID=2812850 RepID=A0A916NIJ4_9MICO|nr:hypothetical protein [Leucobacter soli]CAG7617141.1 hypothetical protein LEUCIP111803_02068 [Leucobacter soli]
MNTTERSAASRWRSALAGLGTAALIGGLVGFAPTAATAATTYTITGKVTFSGNKKLNASKSGYLDVYDSKCNWVGYDSVTWKGSTYTLKTSKSGSYRIVYNGYAQSAKTPYGLSSAVCAKAKTVKVSSSKKKAKHNLSTKAKGNVYATVKSLKSNEYLMLFDAKTKKWAHSSYGWVAPGSYKLAKAKWNSKKQTYVPTKVFGTSSKSLSKGKTITVKSKKAIDINFDKKTVKSVKDFSYKAKAKATGSPKVGKVLKVKPSGFPKGTKFTYTWYRYGGVGKDGKISGAKKTSYKLTANETGAYVYALVKAKKSGYKAQTYWSNGKQLKAASLTQVTPQSVNGLVDGVATVDVPVTVTKAKFSQSGVRVDYLWSDQNGNESYDASFTPGFEHVGQEITLQVSYWKRGYKFVTRSTTFTVMEAPVDLR